MSDLPAYEQVLEVPVITRRSVVAEHLDQNLHVNVRVYLDLAIEALGEVVTAAGLGEEYIEQRRLTLFTAEHHLRYVAELRLGDEISVHVRFLERSDKALHAMAFVLNRSARRLACILEATVIHVGMDTRRPENFPDDIGASLDRLIEAHAAPWPAPTCGVMGIRQR